ncbi:MAG: glycosyltransferase family 39 protein [Anaerolineaceae bacterium]|nr:glycosyltransferase family 39 protein [Anaerolineaceae bacterium]
MDDSVIHDSAKGGWYIRPSGFLRRSPVMPVVWLAVLIGYILAGVALAPFHGDESTQIYMSRDYAYQFIQRDLSQITYSADPANPTEQHLRLLNGTISKYVIGLAWHLAGYTLDNINDQWDWGADWDYNQANGHAPSPDLLLVARWVSALFLAAGMVVIFALGDKLGGKPAAYLASLYYVLNPALLLNGRRAMMEGSFMLFSLLTVLAGVWFIQKPDWKRGVLLGVAGGLALASKHTALFTVMAIWAGCGVYALVSSSGDAHRRSRTNAQWLFAGRLLPLLLAGLVAVGVFLALNPAWWDNPVGRAGNVLALRADLLQIQVDVFGGYTDLGDKITGFWRQSLIALPQYYEVTGWDGYIGDQIAAYETSPWHGVSIGGSAVGAALFLVMIGVGLWALLRLPSDQRPVYRLTGGWALMMIGSTLLLTPLEWQRYYLPVYPALGLLSAVGLATVGRLISAKLRSHNTR